jgi:hypothetical protein
LERHGDDKRRLPAIGVGLQVRPDALTGQRFLPESRDDVHMSVKDVLAADPSAVPPNVVAIG